MPCQALCPTCKPSLLSTCPLLGSLQPSCWHTPCQVCHVVHVCQSTLAPCACQHICTRKPPCVATCCKHAIAWASLYQVYPRSALLMHICMCCCRNATTAPLCNGPARSFTAIPDNLCLPDRVFLPCRRVQLAVCGIHTSVRSNCGCFSSCRGQPASFDVFD